MPVELARTDHFAREHLDLFAAWLGVIERYLDDVVGEGEAGLPVHERHGVTLCRYSADVGDARSFRLFEIS